MSVALTSVDELITWARDRGHASGPSALGGVPFLAIDAGSPAALRAPEALVPWLADLPCPVIACAAQANVLSAACDVHVSQPGDLDAVTSAIRRAPRAAAVLVQVLRAIERTSLQDGLLIESLAYATLQGGPEFQAWRGANPAPISAATTPSDPAVQIERSEAHVELRLNRPARRNAMSVEMRDALIEALQLVMSDDSIKTVRLTGHGRCFSTGGDLDEFGSAPDTATAHLVRSLALPGRLLAACADRVTTHVHGACIGSGIELPAFSGRLVATPDAWFQLPELRYGLIPGAGGCVSVSRRIGRQRTAWMALSGERVSALRAQAWGLVDTIEALPPQR